LRHVEQAIAIHVGDPDASDGAAADERRGEFELAVAAAKEEPEAIPLRRHQQILPAVTAQVGDRDVVRFVGARPDVSGRLERAVAVAQQEASVVPVASVAITSGLPSSFTSATATPCWR